MNYKVYIQELPFEEILRSAYETLKVECQGVLFGEQQEKRNGLTWVVESAHPIQLAKRESGRTTPQDNRRGDWSLISDKIGEYHSHTWDENSVGLIKLSEEDKNGLTNDGFQTEIITTIKEVKVTRKVGENLYLVSGYIFHEGRKYKIDIGSYYYNGRIRRAEISVPRRILRMIQ